MDGYAKVKKELEDFKFEAGNLENYSPWFSSFQSDSHEAHMEIPGMKFNSIQFYPFDKAK